MGLLIHILNVFGNLQTTDTQKKKAVMGQHRTTVFDIITPTDNRGNGLCP